MKQKNYIVGLYLRLSKDDERQGESLSIDHQRTILRKYAEEHGFTVYDEYIDDGVSGTTFQRPEVQRLLDDAKTGVINTSKTCKLKPIRQKDLEDLVLQTTSQLLDDEETLSAIADEIEVMHAKMRKDHSVLCSLLAQREKAQKSLNNLLKAIEEGILTATTKTRMTELEEQIALLDIKIKGETQKEEQVITKDPVIAYLRNIAKYEPRFLINVFVKEIVLYNDKIEIYYYYTDKKDPDEPTDKVHRDLFFHHYNVRVRKTYFELLTKIKKDTAHCSRSSTVSLLVHRKRFELLAFGSVDRRYIQLS